MLRMRLSVGASNLPTSIFWSNVTPFSAFCMILAPHPSITLPGTARHRDVSMGHLGCLQYFLGKHAVYRRRYDGGASHRASHGVQFRPTKIGKVVDGYKHAVRFVTQPHHFQHHLRTTVVYFALLRIIEYSFYNFNTVFKFSL